MRSWIPIALCLVACKRDHAERPAPPPPSVHVRRLSPVIGERFVYRIDQALRLVLSDGTATLAAEEQTAAEAEETITAVAGGVATERTIRFLHFIHRPLGAEQPLEDVVTGKTFRWPATGISDAERAALAAYVRRDTGEPDLATYLFTDRDFERGVPWSIPADQPAPFARGLHAGTTITLVDLDGGTALFDVTQIMLLELRGERVPITLNGRVTVDVGRARVVAIDVDGHVTEPTGPVREAHMTSHQAFTYAQ